MATKIGIISDTHGLLRPEVLDALESCDCIIHGGDINRQEIIDALQEIAPLYVVRGNNDKEWAEHLPHHLVFVIEGCRFFLVHNKKDVPKNLEDVDVVVFGHSHKYFQQSVDGRLWLNPGSCGKRRFDQEITFAVMTVEGRNTVVEKIAIAVGQGKAVNLC
ncbi:metallophosphoesterase family protein [Ihubacter sp. rT4E-8]|uniref:metallophosphoesterase family protein n=1 Tax=Ihubacter sp. rT4E-8 TaxID=3242369 RepID=UPI003CE9A4F0